MQAVTTNRITQTSHLTSRAVDYSARPDPIVYCPEDGTIDSYQRRGTGRNDAGNTLRLNGATGLHQFAHLEVSYVAVGSKVKRGQKLAKMGYTGFTIPTGAGGRHLHYWVKTPKGYVYPPNLVNQSFIKQCQVIKGEDMTVGNPNWVKILFRQFVGRDPTAKELADYTSKDWHYILSKLSKARKDLRTTIKQRDEANKTIAALKAQLAKAGDPTSNDEAVKKSLKQSIIDYINKVS
ncbi:hypothetical protein BH23PAT2_BH23PAT2_08260 [soil metagenome]